MEESDPADTEVTAQVNDAPRRAGERKDTPTKREPPKTRVGKRLDDGKLRQLLEKLAQAAGQGKLRLRASRTKTATTLLLTAPGAALRADKLIKKAILNAVYQSLTGQTPLQLPPPRASWPPAGYAARLAGKPQPADGLKNALRPAEQPPACPPAETASRKQPSANQATRIGGGDASSPVPLVRLPFRQFSDPKSSLLVPGAGVEKGTAVEVGVGGGLAGVDLQPKLHGVDEGEVSRPCGGSITGSDIGELENGGKCEKEVTHASCVPVSVTPPVVSNDYSGVSNDYSQSIPYPEVPEIESVEGKRLVGVSVGVGRYVFGLWGASGMGFGEWLERIGCYVVVCEVVEEWCLRTLRRGSERVRRIGADVLYRCGEDIGVFAALFFRRYLGDVSSSFHREVYDLLHQLTRHDGEIGRKMALAAPRGSAKSTLISLVYICWLICFKIREFILLISDSEDQAAMLLDAVKAEFEANDDLRRVFGDLRGEVWGAYAIETVSGVRVMARGAGQKIRGLKFRDARPGIVLLDDVESDTTVENAETRRKLKQWFYGAVLPCGSPECIFAVIGTLLHEDSLLNDLIQAKGWFSKIYDAEDDGNGEALWPARFPKEKLAALREEYESQNQLHVYFREYRNQFIDTESATFQRRYFVQWTQEEFDEYARKNPTRTFLTLDPAYTRTQRSDFTAFVITSTDTDNRLYVRKVVKERLHMPDIFKIWIKLHLAYRPNYHGVQNIDWAKSLEIPLKEEQRRQGIFFPVKELPTYAANTSMFNKEARIERLAPRYAQGSIIHVGPQPELETELLAFPRGKHIDTADCLAMALDLIWPAPKRTPKALFPSYTDPISAY